MSLYFFQSRIVEKGVVMQGARLGIAVVVMILHTVLFAEFVPYMPKLQKGEVRFRTDTRSYGWDDFHLAWDVSYFDVVRYSTEPNSDGKTFILPDMLHFETIFQVGKLPEGGLKKQSTSYLAKAVLTPEYFWKYQLPLLFSYTVYTLRFIDAKDGRLKAIETVDEIRQMLGRIDTPAELALWLLATEPAYARPYSFKKDHGLYRVRFLDDEIFSCSYHEYMKFFDAEGRVVRQEEVKKVVYERPCPEIAL
jgi:hypothetical protein